MKYLLLPFTLFGSFLITYISTGFCAELLAIQLVLPTFWFVILLFLSSSLIYGVSFLSNFYNHSLIRKIYGTKSFLILHFLSSLVAFIFIILYLFQNDFSSEGNIISFLLEMIKVFPVKTILIMLLFVGLMLSHLYTLLFFPIFLVFGDEDESN